MTIRNRPGSDTPLIVACPHCGAGIGNPCTAVGTRNGVRALDALLDLGWRPGGER